MNRFGAMLAALLLIMITGCSSTPTAGPASTSNNVDGAFPLTLTHALGSLTIDRKPERIVTLGEDLDTLAALGIVPVAYVPVAPGYTDNVPYQADRIDLSGATVLDGASRGEIRIEQIAATTPDLILASNFSGIEEHYEALSKIAPTLAFTKGWGQTTWQDMSLTIGRAVGDPDGAKAAVAKTEDYLATLAAELPGLQGKTVAGAYYYASGSFASNPRSASMEKYTTLGMKVNPALLEALPEGKPNTISREQMEVLDSDVLFLSCDSAELQRELETDPIFQKFKAVRNKTVSISDPKDVLSRYAGNNPTLLNIVWLLDQQRDFLTTVR